MNSYHRECFHNFLAFSQWGNTLYNTMARLEAGYGDPSVRSWFTRTMTGAPDEADGAFTPLDRFVMELFRTISPNAGSLSTVGMERGLEPRSGSVVTPHPATSQDPRHWRNPEEFDPDRYKAAPTTVDNNEAKCEEVGLARGPSRPAPFAVSDGRRAELTNSAFGAVYGVVEGTAYPVCDTAGYAPFGFGYRRCAGEQITTEFIKQLVRTVWRDRIEFVTLGLEHPEKLPVSPRTVIDDNIGFRQGKRGSARERSCVLRCASLGYTRPASFLITWQPAARRQNASAGSANRGATIFGIRILIQMVEIMTTTTAQSTTTIGDFLLRRLREAGISHLFGVAGDFNLEFLLQMEDRGEFMWVGNCNELNAAYAADGYARLNGISGLVVTNGVGAWSAINGVAGAYSEHVPVVCVCGSLPLKAPDRNLLMHHTSADTDYDAVLRGYAQVTAAQARVTPRNAVAEIDRLILTAWQRKLPVYLELPSDIAYLEVEVPAEPLQLAMPPSDPERLNACAEAILARLSSARSPAILIDLDADRFDVAGELLELAGKLRLPFAAINTAKGVIDETSPYFLGLYAGAGSKPEVREAVEHSDGLLAIGVRRVDTTNGHFSDALPEDRIDARGESVDIGSDNYQAVYLKKLLRRVADRAPSRESAEPRPAAATQAPSVAVPSGPLTQAAYWNLIQGFVREGDVLIAEDGTSEAGCWGLQLPPRCSFITQAVWGSIGYSVGSVLGTLLAEPERRHLLFVGDGSFQLTAQEVSTMLQHDLKPIIFLINNGGYTIERTICGKNSHFNDVANWAYAELPKVLHPGTTARTFVVKTAAELQDALAAPHDSMIFIEAVMDKYDAPQTAIEAGHGMAEVDYGPRGPQHRPGVQI